MKKIKFKKKRLHAHHPEGEHVLAHVVPVLEDELVGGRADLRHALGIAPGQQQRLLGTAHHSALVNS